MIELDIKETTLENGLKVLTLEDHRVSLATLWAWYKVGSRNEAPGITGASHWVEHMLFKGGKEFEKGEIFKQVTRYGGSLNGFTTADCTCYFETLPSQQLDLALRIEADRIANASFEPKEVEAERTVILSEREGMENHPEALLWEEVEAAAFRSHPYRWSIIGWKADLQAITRQDLYNYYRQNYAPNNATLVIIGDFHTPQLLERIQELFGPLPAEAKETEIRSIEPPQEGERRVLLRRSGNIPLLQVVYHAPSGNDPDVYPLIVLQTVLSGAPGHLGWLTSRLYRALVRTQLAAQCSCDLSRRIDPHLFGFEVTVHQKAQISKVEEALLAEIERVRSEPISDEEMEKAQKQIQAGFGYSLDGVNGIAFQVGQSEMVDTWKELNTYLDKISQVSKEDVQRVAQRYLGENNRTVGCFIPTNGQASGTSASVDSRQLRFMVSSAEPFFNQEHQQFNPHSPALDHSSLLQDVRREVLPNGLTLLILHSGRAPTVSLSGAIRCGSIDEPEESAGLAGLTAALAQRGTEKKTFEQIFEPLDRVGASLRRAGGVHHTTFGGKCHSEDFSLLMETLADVLRNPSFPDDELEKVRGERLTMLRRQEEIPREVALRELSHLLYPDDHPYHHPPQGYLETVSQIKREHIVDFHRSLCRPDRTILVLVGGIEVEKAIGEVKRLLSDWEVEGPSPSEPSLTAQFPAESQRKTVPMPGKSQTDIVLGYKGISSSNPDYYALDQTTLILGGLGLMGRIGENVRDRQGLAYYAFARFTRSLGEYPWRVLVGVNPANVERAVETILEEITRIGSEPVTDEELADAKSHLIGRIPLGLETNDSIAHVLGQIELYDLGLDYLERYPNLVQAITKEDILRAAQEYLPPDRYALVIAGPQ